VELSDAKPLVSIVTPSLNQAPFLEDAMRSVLEQDYPRIEYLVVDGGSTDGSVDIIRRHAARLAWWVSEKDDGQTDAINKGFSRARGEIFGWLNSDDTYAAGAISRAVQALAACPECGLIYGDANYMDQAGRRIGRFPAAQTDYRRLRQGYVHIPQQASFFRADLWKAVAPLDPSLYFAMDYDLWLRIARRSQVKYLPEVWANFRLHTAAKTIADDNRCWPEMLRIHYRDGGRFLSLIVAKYYLRKLFAPFLNWRRRQLLAG
jgi:glycosyltransferase involved in cell wall biosynthesis